MVEVESVDVRGSQMSILRLYGFDKGALLHMLFYRILVFVALAAFVVIAVYEYTRSALAYQTVGIFIVAVYLLFTPQLFAVARVATLVVTKGRVSDKLNASFLNSLKGSRRKYAVLRAIPYACVAIWLMCLPILVILWY